jgi:hypothetical protein
MNLVEGEIIQQIEEVDEGWWTGVGGGGSKAGLFPGKSVSLTLLASNLTHFCSANFVEIVKLPETQEEAPPPPPPPPPPVSCLS